MRSTIAIVVVAAFTLSACRETRTEGSAPVASSGLARVDFNADVQPILSEYCYSCHGPDPGGRKAKLRLDRGADALAKREKGQAIVPGNPDKSTAMQRILSHDPKLVMPPPEMHKTMKPEEIAVIRQWIKEGAVYQDHWAFIPPKRYPIPEIANRKSQITNPVDSFILARLEKEKLPPSEEADPRTLIRRVTLDLTGLLPTPDEVEAFVNDTSPDRYEKLVDRLLASPRYGEHRARYWLDYVRYADTHGIHFDNYREIWPYRDYVIKAFNENKPFDQFVREQLAGDMLPATNLDQIVATGYLRCNQTSNEGGGVPEEFLANNTRDKLEAYGSAFLGLTVQCAGCHDHKFDPMTMDDFYQLASLLGNTAELPWDLNIANPKPVATIPPPEKRAAFDAALAKRAEIQKQIRAREADAFKLVSSWLASGKKPQPVSQDKLALRLKLDEGHGDVFTNSAPAAKPATFKSEGGIPQWGEEWVHWPAMRMENTTKLELGQLGDFEKDQPFSAGGWFCIRGEPGNNGTRSGSFIAKMDTAEKAYPGWDINFADGTINVHVISKWPSDALKISESNKIERSVWHHIFFSYDGSMKAAGLKLYVDGNLADTKTEIDSLKNSIRNQVPLRFGRREKGDEMKQARYQDIRIYNRSLSADEVARLTFEDIAADYASIPPAKWTPDQRHTMTEFYLTRVDTNVAAWRAEVAKLDAEMAELSRGGPSSLVVYERNRQNAAYILGRGVYSARGKRVFPGTPHFLPGASNATPDRLALADWTMSTNNPLVARVVVNRMWQEIFGAGIVETADDFGVMGARPSHPELLDWLATEFRDAGWDVKKMYKLLVTSATYRQSSKVRADIAQKDPRNKLLARGPRFRMDGEMLRDSALQSGGLLAEAVGGRSVKPYQPQGVWEAVTMPESNTLHYNADKGTNLYRRSLYTFWKRFAPPAALETLDAPGRDVVCPRRQRTNTPLQALALMNETGFVEAYRKIAERVIASGTTADARLDFLSSSILARPLEQSEKQVLQKSLEKFSAAYDANPGEAKKLLGIGDMPATTNLPPQEIAAWTLVASQVMNMDEALNK